MYSPAVRARALLLLDQGLSLSEVSRRTGVNRSTLRTWRQDPDRTSPMTGVCARCVEPPRLPEPCDAYAYLLGLYLGDGCLSPVGDLAKGVWAMRIICADAWPGLMRECERALRAVRPTNRVRASRRPGSHEISSYSKHWPHMFPQHGPGKKHHRAIMLQPWQEEVARMHPGPLVRGLMHSDGYRGLNRVRRELPGGVRWYEYPRYLFKNESADILRICGEALDRLGVAWRYSKRNEISVARREAVALLDCHVGPKA
ncbi:helix-turn-helix domain-containing protein [Nonomuraea sp. NPDC050790]|uniref:helix-turn-helix domain-containing protein n=1 Tax=Nonomuraea sp. NPDC050790 TaxID=3364371 RepID=UPI0037918587